MTSTYRKIGGIHWLALGRLRLSFCLTKAQRIPEDMIPFSLANLPAQIEPYHIAVLWLDRINAMDAAIISNCL